MYSNYQLPTGEHMTQPTKKYDILNGANDCLVTVEARNATEAAEENARCEFCGFPDPANDCGCHPVRAEDAHV